MKKLTSLLFLLFCFQMVFGCDCGWNGGLLKNTLKNKLTIHGKVTKHLTFTNVFDKNIPTSIKVEITQIIKGKIDSSFITVWGDRGADCRPYLTNFDIGSEWMFSLNEINKKEFAISNCGENVTPVKEGETWGYIFYNDRCSINEYVKVSIDSFIYAVNHPNQFEKPTRSCLEEDKGKHIFIKVSQMPKYSINKSIHDFVKEEISIKNKIKKRGKNISISFDLVIDEKGDLIKIKYIEFPLSQKRKRKYYQRQIKKILKKSSPWIPGEHKGKKVKVRTRVNFKVADLVKN